MTEKRTSLEIIAPSVEEAVAKGLADLGLREEAVEVEVLDSGSKGLFGIGFRQCRVRLTIKPMESAPVRRKEAEVRQKVEELPVISTQAERAFEPPAPAQARQQTIADAEEGEQDEYLLEVARDTVQDLLAKMRVRARVSAQYGKAEDVKDRIPLLVDIRGDDLSILIGPRSETLNALQYIAALIISKEVGHAVPLVVDVEGYRMRRAQQIRQLAQRMAEQAIRTGKRQVLEPMPASERRLIHIELRDHPKVTTESVGEEPRRKVTILPK